MGELNDPPVEIPTPNVCPDARQQRRMAFRNERNLFTRMCDITGKQIFSVVSPDRPRKVCHIDHWNSESFDPLNYGREYDFNKTFFEQFEELLNVFPWPSLRIDRSENCDYNSDMSDCKNCYLCARTHKSSDMMYCYRGNASSSCVDCYQVHNGSELCYECVECGRCYNCQYVYFSKKLS